jgi:hypothetical protein
MASPLTFADRLANRPVVHAGTGCGVGTWTKTLDAADLTAFNQALEDENLRGSDIHRIMKDMGFPFGQTSVRNHRTGVCLCRSRTV